MPNPQMVFLMSGAIALVMFGLGLSLTAAGFRISASPAPWACHSGFERWFNRVAWRVQAQDRDNRGAVP